MPSFRTRHRVPFSPQQMFDLVKDVERYPEFLPMCEGITVRRRDTVDGHEVLTSTMHVGYKALKESFTTRAVFMPEDSRITVNYLDGPFKHLENRWHFVPDGTGCFVDFYIEYEFRSALLAIVMGAVFDKAFRRFTQAFEERARKIYGPSSRPALGTT